jgi:MFS family permease
VTDALTAPPTAGPKRLSFAAMQNPGYRAHFTTYVLAMMADNIEHVISYWMVFQKFHSASLAGFAVISHWAPFLLFSVAAGALADRFDPRRLIQFGMVLFMGCSLGWGYFFITDSLQVHDAVILLTVHGLAGVFWQTSSQLLLHDIAGGAQLPSAVRLNATARTLGVLVGPAVGGLIMLELGPTHGIFLNVVFYLPLLLWLWKAPYGPRFRVGAAPVTRAVRGVADIVRTIRDIAGDRAIVTAVSLAGIAAFFVGNAYQAQMPGFAHDLGHGDPGVRYSMLLAADACGALVAGIALESLALLRPDPRTALLLAMAWALAISAFATVHAYPLALCALFVAGMFELSFNSMAQTLVQMNAPAAIRGRVIGLYNMASLGMRAFSGVTVGLIGGLVGIHASLAVAALAVLLCMSALLLVYLIRGPTRYLPPTGAH